MSQNVGSLLIPPANLEELDISQGMAIDIILRLLFTEGDSSAAHIEEAVHLPFKVLDELLAHLQQEHLIEVPRTTGGLGRRSYLFSITDEGKARARDALVQCFSTGGRVQGIGAEIETTLFASDLP